MTLSLGLDFAFAILLVITIGYAIVLNRKLGTLRQHKEELERLAVTFSQSTARADESIQRLKKTTDDLQNGINKAQGLRDDLTFLIDRGSLTADRLEQGVRGARDQSEEIKQKGPRRPVEPIETISDVVGSRRNDPTAGINIVGGSDVESEEDLAKQKSQAEKDLIDALRQVR
jgi:hypothetical protein